MPTLKRFCEENRKYSKKFAVVALHDTSVKTFEKFDALLVETGVVKNAGQGKDLTLPFPVLLDASGRTIDAYLPRSYPTTLLLDPAGRLVSCSNEALEVLGEILRSEEADITKLAEQLSRSAGRHRTMARELERASGILNPKGRSPSSP